MLGILRTLVRALVADGGPHDDDGDCLFCYARDRKKHASTCPSGLAPQALSASSDPDWVTGLREDEAHRVVEIARDLCSPAGTFQALALYEALEQRKRSFSGWDGLVRALEDDDLLSLVWPLASPDRLALERFVGALGAR